MLSVHSPTPKLTRLNVNILPSHSDNAHKSRKLVPLSNLYFRSRRVGKNHEHTFTSKSDISHPLPDKISHMSLNLPRTLLGFLPKFRKIPSLCLLKSDRIYSEEKVSKVSQRNFKILSFRSLLMCRLVGTKKSLGRCVLRREYFSIAVDGGARSCALRRNCMAFRWSSATCR